MVVSGRNLPWMKRAHMHVLPTFESPSITILMSSETTDGARTTLPALFSDMRERSSPLGDSTLLGGDDVFKDFFFIMDVSKYLSTTSV